MSYKICIVGLGYVGLPPVHAFASKFKAIAKVQYEELSNGENIIIDVKGTVTNPTWKL